MPSNKRGSGRSRQVIACAHKSADPSTEKLSPCFWYNLLLLLPLRISGSRHFWAQRKVVLFFFFSKKLPCRINHKMGNCGSQFAWLDNTVQFALHCLFFCEHSCEIPLPPNHPFHFNFPIACLHFVPPRHYLGFFLETQHFINTPTHRHRQIHSYTQVEQINWIYSHYNLHKFCMSLTYANAICSVCVAEFLLIYLL